MTEVPPPLVSVVIPVYNDAGQLARCLDLLEEQTYARDKFEVVVVDNSSDVPVAPAVAAYAHARCVLEPRPGSYAARNRGLREAKGDVIAFTDSDCLPEADWLENGVRMLTDDPGLSLVGGTIDVFARNGHSPTPTEVFEILYNYAGESDARSGAYATANLFVRRPVFDAAGSFIDDLRSGGDFEWTRRATRLGFRLGFCSEAVVHHPARRTIADFNRRTMRITGGRYQLMRRGNAGGPAPVDDLMPGARSQTIEKLRRLLQYEGCGPLTRGAVVLLATWARLVTQAERLRLAAGGTPRR